MSRQRRGEVAADPAFTRHEAFRQLADEKAKWQELTGSRNHNLCNPF